MTAVMEQTTLAPVGPPQIGWSADVPTTALPDLPGVRVDPAFVEDIRRHGILHPVLLRIVRGGYRVVAGRRRVVAARQAGLAKVPARILTDDDWCADALLTLSENQHRSPNLAADLEAVEALVDLGYSEDALVEATGINRGRLRVILRLLDRLSADLLDALRAGKVTATAARAAATLPDTLQAGLAAVVAERGRLTLSDVHAARKVVLAAATEGLGDNLFADPEVGTIWRTEVAGHLRAALAKVPGQGYDLLVEALNEALEVAQRGRPE